MAVRADAARATLLLMMVRSDGAVLGTGSGFAVRDSGTPADPRNRVVTATHVAAGAGSFEALGDRLHDMRLSRDAAVRPRRGSHLIAFTSEGTLLGSLDPVVSASASIRGADGGLRDPDTTVLSLRPSSAHAAAVYAAIGGLPLARQWPGIIRGQFGGAGSPGAGTGQSGGPFVGSDGLVYGVLSGIRGSDGHAPAPWFTAAVVAPDMRRYILARYAGRDGNPGEEHAAALQSGETRMDRRNEAFLSPLSDPLVLAALGEAGKVGVSRDAPSAIGRVSGSLIGFPHGFCLPSQGEIGTASGPAPGYWRELGRPARDGTSAPPPH